MGKRNRTRSDPSRDKPRTRRPKKSKPEPPPHITFTAVCDQGQSDKDVCMVHKLKLNEWNPTGVRHLETAMNGKLLIIARESNRIEIWETEHNTCIKTMYAVEERMITGVFCIDDIVLKRPRLFTTFIDGSLCEWSLDAHEMKWNEEVSGGGIWSGALKVDAGKECWLGLACDDGAVRIYHLLYGESFRLNGLLQSESNRALCLNWSGDGANLAVGYADGCARMWEIHPKPSSSLSSGREILRFSIPKKGDETIAIWSILCLEKEIVCGDADGHVRFWDRQFGSELVTFKRHEAEVTVLKDYLHRETHYLLATGADAAIVIFRRNAEETWQYVHVRRPHPHDIHSLIIFRSGASRHQTIMFGSADCLIYSVTCPADTDLIQTFFKKRLRLMNSLPELPTISVAIHNDQRIAMVVHRMHIDFWKIPNDPEVAKEEQNDGEIVPMTTEPVLLSRMKVTGTLPITIAALSNSLSFLALSTSESFKLIRIDGMSTGEDAITYTAIKISKPDGPASLAQFSEDSTRFFLVDCVEGLMLFDTWNWKANQRIKLDVPSPSFFPFRFRPSHLTLSNDSSFLAFAVYDVICIYAVHALGIHPHCQFREAAPVVRLCFDATDRLICLNSTRKVHRYDLECKVLDNWSVSNPTILAFRNIPYSPAHSISPRKACSSVVLGFGSGSMYLSFDHALTPMTHPSANRKGCNPRIFSLAPHQLSLFLTFMNDQSILSIYADWNEILQKRPAPVYRHRYGT